jgi:hypothetical protein
MGRKSDHKSDRNLSATRKKMFSTVEDVRSNGTKPLLESCSEISLN